MEDIRGVKKIEQILPQRYPFLFIDRILSADEKKQKLTCLKNLSINEDYFDGHFPKRPVMPGAIIIEAMAQASIILFAVVKPDIAQKHPDYYLGKVEAKFIRSAKPGNQLILTVRGVKILDRGGIVKAVAKADNRIIAEARIAFGVKLNNE